MPVAPRLGTGRFLLVIPTYNELENLARLVSEIRVVRTQTPYPGDVLIVDDNSPDGTGELAARLAANVDWVHVIHRPEKLGLGKAYVDGFRWALARGYTHVIEMDADWSHPPAAITDLLEARVDLAIGSRYVDGGSVDGWPLTRRLISKLGSIYVRLILGLPVHDTTSGFKCFHRRALTNLDLDTVCGEGYVFQVELKHRIARMGGSITEVPIVFADRTNGRSKMTLGIVLEAVWRVPWLRVRAPRDPELAPDPASDAQATAS